MNIVQKASLSLVASAAAIQTTLAASGGMNVQRQSVNDGLKGRGDDLETGVQSIMVYITGFLYLIAVAYALYGGFLILTSGGSDDKVKKGKTILMHGGLGLLVIFLASSIVSFILGLLTA